MVIFLVVYILVNAARAFFTPAAFAEYFGLPLSDSNATAFVFVYGIRALFLGVFGAALLLRRSYPALALFVLVATIMPLGDAILVALAGAAPTVILRHCIVIVFLGVTWYLLRRWLNVAMPDQVA
jgi:hypothetical protein